MKIFYTVTGTISLVLGIIGIFVPLLPTTPFLLLSAAFYFRGSPRLYRWLIQQKQLGPYIKNFREYRAIPLRAKIISLSLMDNTQLLHFPNSPLPLVENNITRHSYWHYLAYPFIQNAEKVNRQKDIKKGVAKDLKKVFLVGIDKFLSKYFLVCFQSYIFVYNFGIK